MDVITITRVIYSNNEHDHGSSRNFMFHLDARRYLGIDRVSIMIYPGFQMVYVDNRLFIVHTEWDELKDIWTQYLKLLQDGRVDTTCQIFTGCNWPFIASGLVGPNQGFHVPMHEKTGVDRWTCKYEGVYIMMYLKRIQRWVKHRQAYARGRRRLAVLMCLHDRLLLGRLPVDIITCAI